MKSHRKLYFLHFFWSMLLVSRNSIFLYFSNSVCWVFWFGWCTFMFKFSSISTYLQLSCGLWVALIWVAPISVYVMFHEIHKKLSKTSTVKTCSKTSVSAFNLCPQTSEAKWFVTRQIKDVLSPWLLVHLPGRSRLREAAGPGRVHETSTVKGGGKGEQKSAFSSSRPPFFFVFFCLNLSQDCLTFFECWWFRWGHDVLLWVRLRSLSWIFTSMSNMKNIFPLYMYVYI